MRDWKQKMQNSTAAMITAITKLHCSPSSPNNNTIVCHIVKAMADMIEIQERVNTKLQEQLREHHRRLTTTEKILAQLRLQTVTEANQNRNNPLSPEIDFENFDSSWQAVSHCVGNKRRRMTTKSSLRTEKDIVQDHPPPTRRTPSAKSRSPRPSVSESNSIKPQQNAHPMRRYENEDEQPSLSVRKVKPPFTTDSIRKERLRKRKEKRRREMLEPYPCEKCCAIKREELTKKYGFLKEDVYHRYTIRRGGCYQYVHYDEKPPDDHPRSQISFDETPTQSPEHLA